MKIQTLHATLLPKVFLQEEERLCKQDYFVCILDIGPQDNQEIPQDKEDGKIIAGSQAYRETSLQKKNRTLS